MTEEGNIAVAEWGCQTVSLYSVTGQRIYSFGTANSRGSRDGQFYSPSGIAIRGDIMYVSEESNKRVHKFSISKKSFIFKFGSRGKEEGQFSSPRGFDPERKVFVADNGNHLIQVLNEDNSFAYSFPWQQNPLGLAFDHQGYLHVAVYGSSCIQVFTLEGTPIPSCGSGTLNLPAGILPLMLKATSPSVIMVVTIISGSTVQTNTLFTHSLASSIMVWEFPVIKMVTSGWLTTTTVTLPNTDQ